MGSTDLSVYDDKIVKAPPVNKLAKMGSYLTMPVATCICVAHPVHLCMLGACHFRLQYMTMLQSSWPQYQPLLNIHAT